VNAETRIALGLGLALIVTCAALAQTAPAVQRAGNVEYVSGGAGEEERAAMTAQRGAFALRIDNIAILIGCGVGLSLGVFGAIPPATELLGAGVVTASRLDDAAAFQKSPVPPVAASR